MLSIYNHVRPVDAHAMVKYLTSRVVAEEYALLDELGVRNQLQQLVSTDEGLQFFARSFYFVRSGFPRLNFILGARCPDNEAYWSGIANNIYEELGGGHGVSHNQLYRDFMLEAGGLIESALSYTPDYAAQYKMEWTRICQEEDLETAILLMTLYEALDQPDYRILYEVFQKRELSKKALLFFKVHAHADHPSLFEPFFEKTSFTDTAINNAMNRVIEIQKNMWSGFLEYCSHAKSGS